jgi:nicotinamidase-related amidase
MQIFHPVFLINEKGEHPAPFTLVAVEDIEAGVWRFNPAVANDLHIDEKFGQRYLQHYVRKLKDGGKYELTIWPYHAMLGGLGHALVPAVEEAIFFHSLARFSQPDFQVKGNNPFTENYSVLRPEITGEVEGKLIAESNTALAQKLLSFDAVIIAGQAKSHCVAWTIDDLLKDAKSLRRNLAQKVYLLEDCTSPVVVPGVIDYTEQADRAFQKFAAAGMHLARSTEPLAGRPGFEAAE